MQIGAQQHAIRAVPPQPPEGGYAIRGECRIQVRVSIKQSSLELVGPLIAHVGERAEVLRVDRLRPKSRKETSQYVVLLMLAQQFACRSSWDAAFQKHRRRRAQVFFVVEADGTVAVPCP